ncbi:MAG: transglutaminase family protein [Sphingobacteriales bacterium]|jgi:regulator of sirC expression with transglutaminase-like and TPR domain
MDNNKEINALFHLMDDPDEDVYSTVSDRILSFGKEIIPSLETFSETSPAQLAQERIGQLIHRLQFEDLLKEFEIWTNQEEADILEGAMLVAKFVSPDVDIDEYKVQVEKIRRNIWLELNSYLTALEQVNIVNKILFSHIQIKGEEVSYDNKEAFLLPELIDQKKGNAISIGILYQYLCKMLDISVQVINMPRQFILAYFDDSLLDLQTGESISQEILFFIEPVTGQVYTKKDVDNYLTKINQNPTTYHFKPLSSKKIIGLFIDELAKCYEQSHDEQKKDDLLRMRGLL